MILTLKTDVSESQVKEVEDKAKEMGFSPEISRGEEKTLILVKGDHAILSREVFEAFEAVDFITPISDPFKLVSKQWSKKTLIKSAGHKIGGNKLVFMAGPCSIENQINTLKIAKEVKSAGAGFLRGGAFKPRTSPYSFQGLGEEGLKILKEAADQTGLGVVTEAMDIRQLEIIHDYADIIQMGTRNMQNFELLKECGKAKKPILLKRGFANTIKEFLMSAEYIAAEGNTDIILCERGIRTFSDYTRFTLDVSAVPVLKKLTHLPVIIDPSHPAGKREFVDSLSYASIAAGADGLIVEVHTNPEKAVSDGSQTVNPQKFKEIMGNCKKIAGVFGRQV